MDAAASVELNDFDKSFTNDRRNSAPIGTGQGDLMEIMMVREMEQFIRRPIRGDFEARVSMAVSVIRTKNHDMLRMLRRDRISSVISVEVWVTTSQFAQATHQLISSTRQTLFMMNPRSQQIILL